MTSVISGVEIPDSKLAREAAELVRQYEDEMLFNHSVRVYVFGAMKGLRQKLRFDPELLYVAALFHDLGLVDHYHTATKRFEVDGADAARDFLRARGIAEPQADLVWEAIALHDVAVHAAQRFHTRWRDTVVVETPGHCPAP